MSNIICECPVSSFVGNLVVVIFRLVAEEGRVNLVIAQNISSTSNLLIVTQKMFIEDPWSRLQEAQK